MRLVSAIVALCVFSGAYLIILIDRRHERIRDPRRASRMAVRGSRVIGLAGLILLAWAVTADARPVRHTGWSRAGHGIIGGRPAGCPHRFCGCGASLYLFGRIIPALNLAANWLRFPRVAPAPNMVAARRGHVFVLQHHIAGNTWLVHDSNSGHGRTRIHPRSIAGYAIVNPHGRG